MDAKKAIAYIDNTIRFNDLEYGSLCQLSEVKKFLADARAIEEERDRLKAELASVKRVMLLGCQDSESVCPFWQNWHDSDEENKMLTAELARMREALDRISKKASSKPYASQAHHCDYRVLLEGVNNQAQQALGKVTV